MSQRMVPSVRMISVPRGTLEVLEHGAGSPLVLLHGGTGSIDEWDSCIDVFAERFRVIAYNRRGYGQSSPRYVFSEHFFDEDIEDLMALLETLNIVKPFLCCGFSDGGTIALLFAAHYPGRIKRLVVSGAHVYVEVKTAQGLSKVRERYERAAHRRGLLDTPQYKSQMAWFDRWLGRAFRPFSMVDDLSRIVCPTLVIQGTEDEFADETHARIIAKHIEGAQLWLVKGARHWIHGGDHTEPFLDRVSSFLSENQTMEA